MLMMAINNLVSINAPALQRFDPRCNVRGRSAIPKLLPLKPLKLGDFLNLHQEQVVSKTTDSQSATLPNQEYVKPFPSRISPQTSVGDSRNGAAAERVKLPTTAAQKRHCTTAHHSKAAKQYAKQLMRSPHYSPLLLLFWADLSPQCFAAAASALPATRNLPTMPSVTRPSSLVTKCD
jgi:hypothetical protein